MIYLCFLTVILTCNVSGFMEYNPNSPNSNTKPDGLLTPPGAYNTQHRSGTSVWYSTFPQTFSDHHERSGEQYRQPYEIGQLNTGSVQIPEHSSHSFRPVASRPDQITDHHFLTRPQSIISSPMGLQQYLPHHINPRPFPPTLNLHLERPTNENKPLFDSNRPGITVIAKNIFIHNENKEHPGTSIPYGWIHNGENQGYFLKPASSFLKPEFVDKKSLLFDLLLPKDKVIENKVDFNELAAIKGSMGTFNARPDFSPLYQRLDSAPETLIHPIAFNNTTSQRQMTDQVKPFSNTYSPFFTSHATHGDKDTSHEQTLAQQEKLGLKEFRPLLEPIEETIVDKEFSAGSDENVATTITVTGLENMSIETERPQMDNKEEPGKENEN